MGKLLTSILTIIMTLSLLSVGTYAYLISSEISFDNTFSSGTMDLIMNTKYIDENAWNDGWLSWTKETKDQAIIKTLILENQGTLPGKLTLSFNYLPRDDDLAKKVFLSKILKNDKDDKNKITRDISLFDLSKREEWDQGIMSVNDGICYTFIFNNKLDEIYEPIHLQLIITAKLAQY